MQGLDRLDWNLVPALDALLTERNVSRAARQLRTSQSSASGSLARLRRHFGDELLVRDGRHYRLSPLAQRLQPLASEAVAAARSLIEVAERFDPAVSERTFVLLMSDYAQAVVGPHLIAEVNRLAPHVEVVLQTPATATAEAEEMFSASGDPSRLLSDVDGWFAPREAVRGLPSTGQVEDRWVCLGSTTSWGTELTRDDLASAGWVAFTIPGLGHLPKLRALLSHGLEPRIEVVTDSFTAIPFLVSGTDRLALVQERLARLLAVEGVAVFELPVPLHPLHLTMWWHPKLSGDPGHQWLRSVLRSVLDADPTCGEREQVGVMSEEGT